MGKIYVLLGSFIGTFLIAASFFYLSTDVCYVNKTCDAIASVLSQDNLTLIYILPFVFVLSLITYKMQEAVFQAWWRFAMWFVPLIMIVTYFLYSGHQQSGFGGVAQDAFYFAILVALYAIFILTSLIRIILAYRRLKK